jgi:hypothetical protein
MLMSPLSEGEAWPSTCSDVKMMLQPPMMPASFSALAIDSEGISNLICAVAEAELNSMNTEPARAKHRRDLIMLSIDDSPALLCITCIFRYVKAGRLSNLLEMETDSW